MPNQTTSSWAKVTGFAGLRGYLKQIWSCLFPELCVSVSAGTQTSLSGHLGLGLGSLQFARSIINLSNAACHLHPRPHHFVRSQPGLMSGLHDRVRCDEMIYDGSRLFFLSRLAYRAPFDLAMFTCSTDVCFTLL